MRATRSCARCTGRCRIGHSGSSARAGHGADKSERWSHSRKSPAPGTPRRGRSREGPRPRSTAGRLFFRLSPLSSCRRSICAQSLSLTGDTCERTIRFVYRDLQPGRSPRSTGWSWVPVPSFRFPRASLQDPGRAPPETPDPAYGPAQRGTVGLGCRVCGSRFSGNSQAFTQG